MRIDIRLEVPAISVVDLIKPSAAESSSAVAERVASARDLQRQRFLALGSPEIITNARCGPGQLDEIAQADSAALSLLREAAESMRLSARGYHRVLKIARTLADLDSSQNIGRLHLAEALSFRVAGARTALAA